MTFEIPCVKALDPVHIINALHNGFDGVMAAVCLSEDCKLQEGKEIAERNITVLKDTLKKMNLLGRFQLFESSPRCSDDFDQRLKKFFNEIAAMPHLEPLSLEAEANA